MVTDPFSRLQMVVAYAVVGVWVITFIAVLFVPPRSETELLGVQAAAMLVLGALFADRVRRGRR